MHVDAASRTLFLTYGVAPDRRGCGLASRAVSLVGDRAFAAGFQQAELEIGDDNVASQGAARRSGFEPTDRRRSPDHRRRLGVARHRMDAGTLATQRDLACSYAAQAR